MALAIPGRMQLLGLLLVGAVCLHLALPAADRMEHTPEVAAATALEADDADASTLPAVPAPVPARGPLHVASLHLAIVVALGATLLHTRMTFSGFGGLADRGDVTSARRPRVQVLEHATGSSAPVASGVLLRV